MWTHHTDSGNNVYGGQTAKNIYLGETRIVTKLNSGDEPTYNEEYYKQYYYHSDHLGSASLITDYKGDEYQRIEYTPYGETWVEKTSNTGLEYLPYRFTGKEIDEETGLYYYGARYLDPRYSRWISTDPAVGEYIPGAGKATASDAGSLPGMGGIFNIVNLQLYHYAGNNPVKYTDPDGKIIRNSARNMMSESESPLGSGTETINKAGCTFTSYVRMANALGANVTLDEANQIAVTSSLFIDDNLLTVENGAILVNKLLESSGITDVTISYESSYYRDETGNNNQYMSYQSHEDSESEYFCNARITTSDADGSYLYGHTVSVDSNALISDRCDGVPTNIKIRDTASTGRTQINGDTSNRANCLDRLDFFKINRSMED